MLFYVVIYDIPDNKRRSKVHDLLSGYGTWVQYSAFECVLSAAKFDELRARLGQKINLEEDSIRFYPVSRHTLGQVEVLGVGAPVTQAARSVII
ncbi:CRISPR-associated endonuclease Cas2 [Microcoleus sp. herbarium12]|uniref:CRISPR-associated endonuclease Cas2 n=1 Tax=Microcoleus sp. herbarium12 TaxID=3055437 RepID=UPI002FD5D025